MTKLHKILASITLSMMTCFGALAGINSIDDSAEHAIKTKADEIVLKKDVITINNFPGASSNTKYVEYTDNGTITYYALISGAGEYMRINGKKSGFLFCYCADHPIESITFNFQTPSSELNIYGTDEGIGFDTITSKTRLGYVSNYHNTFKPTTQYANYGIKQTYKGECLIKSIVITFKDTRPLPEPNKVTFNVNDYNSKTNPQILPILSNFTLKASYPSYNEVALEMKWEVVNDTGFATIDQNAYIRTYKSGDFTVVSSLLRDPSIKFYNYFRIEHSYIDRIEVTGDPSPYQCKGQPFNPVGLHLYASNQYQTEGQVIKDREFLAYEPATLKAGENDVRIVVKNNEAIKSDVIKVNVKDTIIISLDIYNLSKNINTGEGYYKVWNSVDAYRRSDLKDFDIRVLTYGYKVNDIDYPVFKSGNLQITSNSRPIKEITIYGHAFRNDKFAQYEGGFRDLPVYKQEGLGAWTFENTTNENRYFNIFARNGSNSKRTIIEAVEIKFYDEVYAKNKVLLNEWVDKYLHFSGPDGFDNMVEDMNNQCLNWFGPAKAELLRLDKEYGYVIETFLKSGEYQQEIARYEKWAEFNNEKPYEVGQAMTMGIHADNNSTLIIILSVSILAISGIAIFAIARKKRLSK